MIKHPPYQKLKEDYVNILCRFESDFFDRWITGVSVPTLKEFQEYCVRRKYYEYIIDYLSRKIDETKRKNNNI